MSQFQGSRLWVRGQRLCWISSWAVLKKPFWPFWPMMKKPGDLQVTQQNCWLYHNQSLSARNSFGKNSLSGAWLPAPPRSTPPQRQNYLVYADGWHIMEHISAQRVETQVPLSTTGTGPRCTFHINTCTCSQDQCTSLHSCLQTSESTLQRDVLLWPLLT